MTDFGSANIQGALHIATPLGRKKKIKKAEPKTLYVNRPVLNAEAIIAWAKANGFAKTVTPDDMHVTIAFSRTPIDWPDKSSVNEIAFIPEHVAIARFGPEKNCIVLQFDCGVLEDRWQYFNDCGASWDWPDYQPHLTLSYKGYNENDLAPVEIKPYDGMIVLGPEEFAEVNEGWGDTIVEKAFNPDELRDTRGRWTTDEEMDEITSQLDDSRDEDAVEKSWSDKAREASLAVRRGHERTKAHLQSLGVPAHEMSGPISSADGGEDWLMLSHSYKPSKEVHSRIMSSIKGGTLHVDVADKGSLFRMKKGASVDLTEAEQMQKRGARNNKTDKAMIQTMHDHSVSLGASCDYADADVGKVARIAKIDESLGLVFGYAIVCKVNGEPYYDLNIDKAKDGSYKRVPEHIPEESMLKAAVDFMQTARTGNEMHAGPDVGTYVFAFPMTTEIAKAFGIQTSTTGLMIAYKPTPEVFAKYKDGTYTGFSIEGSRVKSVEVEE